MNKKSKLALAEVPHIIQNRMNMTQAELLCEHAYYNIIKRHRYEISVKILWKKKKKLYTKF